MVAQKDDISSDNKDASQQDRGAFMDSLHGKGLFESIGFLFRGLMVPIHSDGWPFILSSAALSLFLIFFSDSLAFFGFLVTAWCMYFFRDPERVTPHDDGKNLVVSSADGLILPIVRCPPPQESGCSDKEMYRISIFMNIFDVHVNRMPFRGTVRAKKHVSGRFLNAMLARAGLENERLVLRMQDSQGRYCVLVQVAGFIARRIRCDVDVGDDVDIGQRFGLIRFGSRVDLYLPVTAEIHVQEGQRSLGGETILASLAPQAASKASASAPK